MVQIVTLEGRWPHRGRRDAVCGAGPHLGRGAAMRIRVPLVFRTDSRGCKGE